MIAGKGLRGLTFRSAASEAGLSHGMIRHHFGTRERLVEAATEYAISRSLAGAWATSPVGDQPRLGDHVIEVGMDNDGVMAFQREIANEGLRNPALRLLVLRVREQYESTVAAQLRDQGVNDPAAVTFVAAAMDGLVYRQMDGGDTESTERALDLMNRLVAVLAESERESASTGAESSR